MAINAKRKGSAGERELRLLLSHIDGVSVKAQPSSGAFGTRIGSKGLQGDLRLTMGDPEKGGTAWRIEAKRRAEPPKVLESWLAGTEVLAIRADHSRWRFYLPEGIFLELVGLAAEGLASRGGK
jgi:hypothetical protein